MHNIRVEFCNIFQTNCTYSVEKKRTFRMQIFIVIAIKNTQTPKILRMILKNTQAIGLLKENYSLNVPMLQHKPWKVCIRVVSLDGL